MRTWQQVAASQMFSWWICISVIERFLHWARDGSTPTNPAWLVRPRQVESSILALHCLLAQELSRFNDEIECGT